MIVRWTFGQTPARPLSPQGIDMLETSIKFAQAILDGLSGSVEYIVCHNNLNASTRRQVDLMAKDLGVQSLDVTGNLPSNLVNVSEKNGWWKYCPPRIDENTYEIIMDNDVVIWNRPESLVAGVRENAFVTLTDAGGQFYGDYQDLIFAIAPNLCLNAGILGLPRNVVIDTSKVNGKQLSDFFHSEQGFVAMMYANYLGRKRQIPLTEVQQLNINHLRPKELILKYDGGHFCGCTYNHFEYWEATYSNVIKNLYTERYS